MHWPTLPEARFKEAGKSIDVDPGWPGIEDLLTEKIPISVQR